MVSDTRRVQYVANNIANPVAESARRAAADRHALFKFAEYS